MGARVDVVVVGGGIVGCALAYYLTRAGASVIVLEGGEIAGEASWAAAGMLAPLAESHGPGPFLDLGLAGLRLHGTLSDELRDETGIDSEYVRSGMLRVALTREEVEELRRRCVWQQERNLPVQWVEAADLSGLESALTPQALGALYSPSEHQVNSGKLTRALAQAAIRQGAQFREGAMVIGLTGTPNHVTGVRLAGGTVEAGHVIVAMGAWSSLCAEWLHLRVPVWPIRGQILAVTERPMPLRHILLSSQGYMVPKLDGRVIVGATEDEAGYDKHITVAGLTWLVDHIPALVPQLSRARFVEAWAGLRPATPDRLPILGPVPGWEGIWLATGHYRNGILLGPITGQLMARALTSGRPDPLLEPFGLGRFLNSGGGA